MLTVKELAKRDFDSNNDDANKSFNENFSITVSHEMDDWNEVWHPIWSEYLNEKNRLRDEFFKEDINRVFDLLDKVSTENGFSYSFGCGCCGGGILIEKDGRAYEATNRMEDEA